MKKTKVLFVCLGNICRSPLAQGVLEHKLTEKGLSDRFAVDSAGTSGWHVGQLSDPRTRKNASQHGVELTSRSRPFTERDFDDFDFIIPMDMQNFKDVLKKKPTDSNTPIMLMRQFENNPYGQAKPLDVPDPYYEGPDGFELVYQLLDNACDNLISYLTAESTETE